MVKLSTNAVNDATFVWLADLDYTVFHSSNESSLFG